MDRRFLLAIVLTIGVIVVSNYLFPPAKVAPRTTADSTTIAEESTLSRAAIAAPTGSPTAVASVPAARAPNVGMATSASTAAPIALTAPAESTVVRTARATIYFTSLGAAPLAVTLDDYKALGTTSAAHASLGAPGSPLLRYAIVSASDTTRFDQTVFALTRGAVAGRTLLDYRGTQRGIALAVHYELDTANAGAYLVRSRVSVEGAPANAFLRVELPRTLASQETKPDEDAAQLAYAFKPQRKSASSIAFTKLDPGEHRLEPGPMTWIAAKNKYFVVALLADSVRTAFEELHVTGQIRTGKLAMSGEAQAIASLAKGPVEFELYAGPQAWERLRALGRDFDNVNPYGGWMQGAVQPFATIVMRVLLWMKRSSGLSYGWILIVFAIAVRVLLWPMNNIAMRSSIKMQRVQPELAAVQEKYKGEPAKLQEEMMKVYKAHDMSPFSAFSGCLPMLIPMPILFALFFVFQNTIEFRGVNFLWLPDISLADPLYVFPILMAASMYLLSWLGMRNSPPNPQAKMMSWLLPGMMLVMFLNFASGLTLYYFVQNVAAIPQQFMIANERSKAKALTAPA